MIMFLYAPAETKVNQIIYGKFPHILNFYNTGNRRWIMGTRLYHLFRAIFSYIQHGLSQNFSIKWSSHAFPMVVQMTWSWCIVLIWPYHHILFVINWPTFLSFAPLVLRSSYDGPRAMHFIWENWSVSKHNKTQPTKNDVHNTWTSLYKHLYEKYITLWLFIITTAATVLRYVIFCD